VPTLRKLTPAEVAALEKQASQSRHLVALEYDRMLAAFGAGHVVEVELDPDDDRRTVRNRFKAAAERRDLLITFLPNREGILRFKLRAKHQPAPRQVYREQPPAYSVRDTRLRRRGY
jgi:hypothetical protein